MDAPHPFFEGLEPTLHISHRGGALCYPENTMHAFQASIDLHHTDMIETDVRFTADGRVVIFHDETLERTTDGEGPIHAQTWGALQGLDAAWHHEGLRGTGVGLPLLSELLAAWPELKLNIEMKADLPGFVEAFAELVKPHADRICVGSELDEVAFALLEALPDHAHYYPRGPLTQTVMAIKMSQACPADDRFCVLDMPLEYEGMRLVDEALLEATRAAGKWVNVWTIDDETDMRALRDLGVGGIMTDRPDLLRCVLEKVL